MLEKFLPTAVLMVFIVAFGIWVSRTGKPYNGTLFNIHKLVALSAVVLTGLRIFRMDPFLTFPSSVLLLLGLAVLGVIALFATGAVMSIQAEVKPIYQWLHGVSMGISVVSFAAAIFLTQSN